MTHAPFHYDTAEDGIWAHYAKAARIAFFVVLPIAIYSLVS